VKKTNSRATGRTTRQVNIRLSPEHEERLALLSERRELDKSEMVRWLIDQEFVVMAVEWRMGLIPMKKTKKHRQAG
jgi:hypothetical protein